MVVMAVLGSRLCTTLVLTRLNSYLQESVRKMSQECIGEVSLKSVLQFLEDFAPKHLAENWDNTGLLLEPMTQRSIKNILLTNDLTENVVKEAILAKADLIVAYHPPIFQSLKNVTTSTWKGRIIGACIENKIAVYSPHTSWDAVSGGVNDWLASPFEYEIISPIVPKNDACIATAGAGRYLKLKEEITLSTAVNNIKNLISQPHIQIALGKGATLETKIKDIALCAGSGSSVLGGNPAKLYITGEMAHHALLDAVHLGSSVILCNHSNSERGFLKRFKKLIEDKFNQNVKVMISKEDKDPLQFV